MPVLPRLILLHKQKTSGRVRFLCFSAGILAFKPLPALAALRDEDYSPTVHFHPTAVLREAEAEFAAWVDTPEGDVPVLLAAFSDLDPPFAAAERSNGRFIAITESRHLSDVERQLLRRAYEHVLG